MRLDKKVVACICLWVASLSHAQVVDVGYIHLEPVSGIELSELPALGSLPVTVRANPNALVWFFHGVNPNHLLGVSVHDPVSDSLIASDTFSLESARNCYAVLLDQSEPMRARWGHARDAVQMIRTMIPVGDYFGLYRYSESWHATHEITQTLQSDQNLSAQLDAMLISGNEPQLYQALFRTIDEVRQCKGIRKHVVLLSAGITRDQVRSLNEVAQHAKQHKVSVHTIAFSSFSETLGLGVLEALATETLGLHHPYFNEAQLREVWRKELESHQLMGVIQPVDLTQLMYGQQELTLSLSLQDEQGNERVVRTALPVSDTKQFDNLLISISRHSGGLNAWLVLFAGFAVVGFLFWLILASAKRKRVRLQAQQEQQRLSEQERFNEIQNKAEVQYQQLQDNLQQVANKVDAFNPEQLVNQKGEPFGWLIDLDGQVYELLTYSTTIGRSDTNDVVINDDHVSGQHAILDFKHGVFIWTDRAPTNPTLINGKAIQGSQQIWPNDSLTVGTIELRFVLDQSAAGDQ